MSSDRNLEGDLAEQDLGHLRAPFADTARVGETHEPVFLQQAQVILHVLDVSPNSLRQVVGGARMKLADRAQQRQSIAGEKIARGLDAGEVDPFAALYPPSGGYLGEGVLEVLQGI